jgi:hypothetical protein
MTISSFRKHLIPSLAMASAAFFGGTAGARAADLTSSDPQEQARQLLAPTHTARPAALSGSSMPSGAERALDPQELARRLLAGAHSAGYNEIAAPAVSTGPVDRNASLGDGQALAQRMILRAARSTAKTHTATTAAAAAHSRAVLQ